jgi:hypothetical protein
MNKTGEDILQLPLEERIRLAGEAAIEDVIESHRRAGLPIAILRDGKVVEISPEELRAFRAAKQHGRNGSPNGP